MTEVWTPSQYHAYLAGTEGVPAPPRFLALDTEAPEDELRGRIQSLCKATKHLYYHAKKSQKSTAGWPDDAIVHPEGDIGGGSTLFLWELKRAGEKPSPAQIRWLDALRKVTRIEVACYYPADWPIILEKLRRTP